MMHIALLSQTSQLGYLGPLLQSAIPGLQYSVWPDPACLEAEVAVCWNTPPGLYERMPRLKLIHSIAAGVDNVLPAASRRGLPVCRVVDASLARGMVEYVLWAVLYFHRSFDQVLHQQRTRTWLRPDIHPPSDCRIGVMGLGYLGRQVAEELRDQGYTVSGWARSPRHIEGVASYAGQATRQAFLEQTDVLVNLLPLTEDTRGLLNKAFLACLPVGAALVGCGRGEHLVIGDLLDALQEGRLRGAVLDVFAQEPLPVDSPLWERTDVVITPHMATRVSPEVMSRQIAENIRRLQQGLPLLNQVDCSRGY